MILFRNKIAVNKKHTKMEISRRCTMEIAVQKLMDCPRRFKHQKIRKG